MKLIIPLLLISSSFFAQESDTAKVVQKHKYAHFLFSADETSQARLVTYSYQYLYTAQHSSFKIGGCVPTIGLNLARFFTKKMILGICIDAKILGGFTEQKFSSEFVKDFDDNFISTYTTKDDSLRAGAVKEEIDTDLGGNKFGNIGIMLSLFPQKYGGIILMIKRGVYYFPTKSGYYKDMGYAGGNEHPFIDLTKNYSFEIGIKPYSIFRNSYKNIRLYRVKDALKNISLSFYYGTINLKSADFYGLHLSQMVKEDFMNKYGVTYNYGFKIGLALY